MTVSRIVGHVSPAHGNCGCQKKGIFPEQWAVIQKRRLPGKDAWMSICTLSPLLLATPFAGEDKRGRSDAACFSLGARDRFSGLHFRGDGFQSVA
jgi:hypothetical protein